MVLLKFSLCTSIGYESGWIQKYLSLLHETAVIIKYRFRINKKQNKNKKVLRSL